jgi:hypothetical protein
MAEAKTKKNDASVERFLAGVKDEQRRADCQTVLKIMQEASGQPPAMWGPSIVGFGSYHYKYDSGREGDAPLIGFSPRKQALTLYVLADFDAKDPLLEKLGKCTTGKCCLYIKRLEDIHLPTLKKLIKASLKHAARPGVANMGC